MPEHRSFAYSAIDPSGRRVKGVVEAADATQALDTLHARSLSPLKVRPTKGIARGARSNLSDREIAQFVSDLAALLRAGADLRMGLSIVGSKTARPELQSVAREMSGEIAGGRALHVVFRKHLGERRQFIAALVTAGEASGDLAGSLERAAEIIEGRLAARDELFSVLAYPTFVLISAIVAMTILLVMVIPSLAPLAEAPGAHPGGVMLVLLELSNFLRTNGAVIGAGLAASSVILALAGAIGLLRPLVDWLLLAGPLKRIAGAMIYGSFAISLGGLLAAGAPVSDAIRLATGAVRSSRGQRSLETVARAVRQGERLSTALEAVPAFPSTIVRLTIVGEQAASIGPMLVRAGRFEEKLALRRISLMARVIGPAMIVALGALIGLMMTGLLTGISDLGDSALQ